MTKWQKRDRIKVGNQSYTVIRVLGKRPGGDLYLVMKSGHMFTLKDCSHLTRNEGKAYIARALEDYDVLKQIGIAMPELVCADEENGILIKKYIGGDIASNLILSGELKPEMLEQILVMGRKAEAGGICLDYFPTNFVVSEKQVYYLHYYCIDYDQKYSFDNRGCKYWMNGNDVMRSIATENDSE